MRIGAEERVSLSCVERLRLAHLPTLLEPLERLSSELGGPRVYVKRDDCTGLAGGGNKTRKLEYLLADAIRCGYDTVLTAGTVQSNHARQTAAACARLGLGCELFLKQSVPARGPTYGHSGNVLLDRIYGAKIGVFPRGADTEAEMEKRAATLREEKPRREGGLADRIGHPTAPYPSGESQQPNS